ncbi:staygreen family protein [Inediibacterium massiliense]|uniref:staygreen family protein n=1 Tax=Inediibacterium massiliense TaxID=1658111 RepID=UPI000AD90143|nr:staygreen family protein [Inediibacterium massiliense]
MNRLNPEKLSVEFRKGVTPTEPIIPRRYTLTHSDITAELFLTIGLGYAYDQTNAMRDEVLGEWIQIGEKYFYNVYLYIDGIFGFYTAATRNSIFRRELPLALEAIRYGDKEFFNIHSKLDHSPIIVYFHSSIPYFNRIENWGTFSNYKLIPNNSSRTDHNNRNKSISSKNN